jgi:hypothetical protein
MQDTFFANVPYADLAIVIARCKQVLVVRTELNMLDLNFFVKLDCGRFWVFTDVPQEYVTIHRPTEE